MRILLDARGAHVWLKGGHGCITDARVEWYTRHEPFVQYADPQADGDVVLPAPFDRALASRNDVVEAALLDDGRAALVERRDPLALSIVDTAGALDGQPVTLQATGERSTAFDTSAGSEELRGERFLAPRPRALRLAAGHGRLGIAAAASGHVASFSLLRHAFECVLRVPTSEEDELWTIPVAAGLLVAARFNGRWSELRCLGLSGEVLGAWPEANDDTQNWGMASPVVLGDHVVVCTDFALAHVLELPTLREVHTVALPELARDAHGHDQRFGCVTADHVVLGQLVAGRLELTQSFTPLELIERAGARESATRRFEGVDLSPLAQRFNAVFPSQPMLRVGVDGTLTTDRGEVVARPAEQAGLRERPHVLDARANHAVIAAQGVTSLVDLENGATTQLLDLVADRALLLSEGVWLVHPSPPRTHASSASPFDDLFAEPERHMLYLPRAGSPRLLGTSRVALRDLVETSDGARVAFCETAADDAPTRVFRFDEAAPERLDTFAVAARLSRLALDGADLYAIEGTYEGRIVRVLAQGEVEPMSDLVFEWAEVVQNFVVVRRTAYWITPYAPTRPSQVLRLALGSTMQPATVYEASFGALTSLRVAEGRLWWLESQTVDAEANGVNVLEERSVVASTAL